MQIAKRHRLNLGHLDYITILLIGCGGTGSYAALHLAQLAYTAPAPIRLVFIDPDTVEARNIARQNFCPPEVGLPKAVALAHRYSFAYGLAIAPVVGKFEAAHLRRYAPTTNWRERSLTLVVGCVDNAAARRDIAAAVRETAQGWRGHEPGTLIPSMQLWWLDAGNSDLHGQVCLGNFDHAAPQASRLGDVVRLPWPSVQEPGLLVEAAAEQSAAESCAALVAAGVQARTINKMMAGWIDVYCERLLVSGDLDFYHTVIDQRTGQTYSTPIGEPHILDRRGKPLAWGAPMVRAELSRSGRLTPVLCPQCETPLATGFDEVDGERVAIYFCGECDYRAPLEEYRYSTMDAEMAMEGFEVE